MFLLVFLIFVLYVVVPTSSLYCYGTSSYNAITGYYCSSYYSGLVYYSSTVLSVGAIVGAVIGGIVGVVIIVVIIAALCGAFKTTGRRGTVVQPMQTTSTVVTTNQSNSQYPPPPAYPSAMGTPQGFNNQPPPYTGVKPV